MNTAPRAGLGEVADASATVAEGGEGVAFARAGANNPRPAIPAPRGPAGSPPLFPGASTDVGVPVPRSGGLDPGRLTLPRRARTAGRPLDPAHESADEWVDEEPEREPDEVRSRDALLADLRGALRSAAPPGWPVSLLVIGFDLPAGSPDDRAAPEAMEETSNGAATALFPLLRPGERIYRWAPSELAVMLPATPAAAAAAAVTRFTTVVAGSGRGAGPAAPRTRIRLGRAVGQSGSPVKLVRDARLAMRAARPVVQRSTTVVL